MGLNILLNKHKNRLKWSDMPKICLKWALFGLYLYINMLKYARKWRISWMCTCFVHHLLFVRIGVDILLYGPIQPLPWDPTFFINIKYLSHFGSFMTKSILCEY